LLVQHGQTHWWLAGMRRINRALLGEVRGRVLDVGCGPGWMLKELPPAAWGVGVELRREQVVAHPFVLADASRLPFADQTFDLALALDLLEQGGVEPTLALAEARRVLMPGGRLLIRVPAHPWLYGPHDAFWGGARRYRRGELAALVREAGFTVHRLTYANGLLFPAELFVRLLARFGLIGSADLRAMPRPLNRLLAGILALEATWLRRHDLPVGLSLVCLAERKT
jgi:SAM-dependent methyltransferase